VHLGKDPLVKKYDTSSLRMLGCGAAPLGKEHIEAIERQLGVGVKQGYVHILDISIDLIMY
jgi:4-coumarate--CoA ligase